MKTNTVAILFSNGFGQITYNLAGNTVTVNFEDANKMVDCLKQNWPAGDYKLLMQK